MRGSYLTPFEAVLMHEIKRRLDDLPDTFSDYANPANTFKLPFPSVNRVPPRFLVSENRTFAYDGRERLEDLWNLWEKVKDPAFPYSSRIYVYGSMGYGKSHILAAFACLLMKKNERVLYLPNCSDMVAQPLSYLKKAFLFAFPEDAAFIAGCNDYNKLLTILGQKEGICVIVDQLNALDLEEDPNDPISNEKKKDLSPFLDTMGADNIYITSASANHKSALHVISKSNDHKLSLIGGMTTVSILPCNYFSHLFEVSDYRWRCHNGGVVTTKISKNLMNTQSSVSKT